MRTLNAIGIGGRTLVGYDGNFPRRHGNCFSLYTDGPSYDIVNFNAENLDYLLRNGLFWPIKIVVLGAGIAVINDERIGDRWYQDRFCEVCTPRDLLPITQRLEEERRIALGSMSRKECEAEGRKFTIVSINHNGPKPLFP